MHRVELSGCREVEVAEALPDRLLDAPDDAKRREVVRAPRVGEIPGDAELEGSLPVRALVSLPQVRLGQFRATLGDVRAGLGAGELRLELVAIGSCDGG